MFYSNCWCPRVYQKVLHKSRRAYNRITQRSVTTTDRTIHNIRVSVNHAGASCAKQWAPSIAPSSGRNAVPEKRQNEYTCQYGRQHSTNPVPSCVKYCGSDCIPGSDDDLAQCQECSWPYTFGTPGAESQEKSRESDHSK